MGPVFSHANVLSLPRLRLPEGNSILAVPHPKCLRPVNIFATGLLTARTELVAAGRPSQSLCLPLHPCSLSFASQCNSPWIEPEHFSSGPHFPRHFIGREKSCQHPCYREVGIGPGPVASHPREVPQKSSLPLALSTPSPRAASSCL